MAVDEHLIKREINGFENYWLSNSQRYVIIKRLTSRHLMDAMNDILNSFNRSYRVHGAPFNEGANICQLLVYNDVL